MQIILSITSTTPNPSLSLVRYYSSYTSLRAYFPIFCIYQIRISNIFQSFSNLFSDNLAYTLILYISEELRTMIETKLRQFSSITICSSISLPLTPCLIKMGNMYFNPPYQIRFQTIICQLLGSALVKEFATAFRADTENQFFNFINCSIIEFPCIQWQTCLLLASSSAGLINRILRQVNKLPKYYCSSLLDGVLLRQGRIDSKSISIPQRLWKTNWAFSEFDRRKASKSLPTYLLSSITLCLTMQFGIIRLDRYSSILVQLTRGSIDWSTCSVNVSIILRILSAIQYSQTLSSSLILRIVQTRLQQRPFSVSQTHMRQQTSKISSFYGYYDIIQCKNSMQDMLMSELG